MAQRTFIVLKTSRALQVVETRGISPADVETEPVRYPEFIKKNLPDLLAINFARVPQYAAGNYPQSAATAGSSTGKSQTGYEQGLLAALNEFNAHARAGIRTFVVYDDVREAASTISKIENNVKTS